MKLSLTYIFEYVMHHKIYIYIYIYIYIFFLICLPYGLDAKQPLKNNFSFSKNILYLSGIRKNILYKSFFIQKFWSFILLYIIKTVYSPSSQSY